MQIGIGIPNTIPGTTGQTLLEWARRAEARGFSTLASIGRLAYPSYDELVTFAALAAVTERIRFMPNILLAPTRSTAELAKQAASLDQLSGGRLTLGLAVGGRPDDYALAGRVFHTRGRRFDQQLSQLRQAWAGQPIDGSPKPVSPRPAQGGGIPILIGGMADAVVRRVAEVGDGWTAGGAPPPAIAGMIQRVHDAWRAAGREGQPRIAALRYFGLSDEAASHEALLDYYGHLGPETAARIADAALRTPEAIRGALETFAAMGVDELIFDPTVADPAEVDRLADLVL